MKPSRVLRSLATVAQNELRATVMSVRFVVLCALVGFVLVLLAWRLAAVTAAVATPPAYPIWDTGPEGALLAYAFAFFPLVSPAVPLGIAIGSARRDRQSGFVETAMSRPTPRSAIAFGRYLGMFLATAIVFLIIVGASIATMWATLGRPLPGYLVGTVTGASLVLGGLYLAAGLLLTTFFTPTQTGWLSFPVWTFMNGVRPLGVVLAGQFLLVVPITSALAFQAAWSDWVTFTGVYYGLLAPAVPDALGLVVRPTIVQLSDILATTSLSMAAFPWLLALVALYVFFVSRAPLGR